MMVCTGHIHIYDTQVGILDSTLVGEKWRFLRIVWWFVCPICNYCCTCYKILFLLSAALVCSQAFIDSLSLHLRAAKISIPLCFFVTGWGGDFQESTPAPLNTMNLLSLRANKSSLICSNPVGIGRWLWNSMILMLLSSLSRDLEAFFLILMPLDAAFRIKLDSSKLLKSLSGPDAFWQGLVLLLRGFVGSLGSLSPTEYACSSWRKTWTT